MAIVPAPKATDTKGKCTRWRVILYDRHTHKQEWHTIDGGKREAEAFERQQKEKLRAGTYIAKATRKTFGQVAELFLQNAEVRDRRTSTKANYKSVLDCHLLPEFKHREIGAISRMDVETFFNGMHKAGRSVELINRCVRVLKSVLFFAMERQLIERNPLQRFRPYEGKSAGKQNRGAFSELEVRQLLVAARPHERALIGLLCFTGMRPGEAYALRERDVDLEAGAAHIRRNWDWRGKLFTEPKTDAGKRTVALSGWLVAELTSHLSTRDSDPDQLIFATRTGQALNPSNVRRDVWKKVIVRAGVRPLDMYSLRHTFASFGRAAGEASFNVARAMGHSQSTLVDQVYAHSLQSGMASVAERVTARALGEKPVLRVIENTRDVRQPLDEQAGAKEKARASR